LASKLLNEKTIVASIENTRFAANWANLLHHNIISDMSCKQLLDNHSVNKKVLSPSWLAKRLQYPFVCLLIGLYVGSSPLAQTQTNQARKKLSVQNTKQIGFKDKSAGATSKSSSMSLNPGLFQRKDPNELILDSDANLDYRVVQGCLRRSFNEANLPASIGIDNRQFSEFFKSQTKPFFERVRGNCIPYAVAFTTRNRFDSLSIMNGPIQDSKTESLDFYSICFWWIFATTGFTEE
jgi:hypothetical protein